MNDSGAAMDALLAEIKSLPTLDPAVVELMTSLNKDADIDVDNVARRLGRDPGLTARILKVVNSPFYGVSRQVSALSEAVMVLGVRAVCGLVTAAVMQQQFGHVEAEGFDRKRFWTHSLAVAVAAKALARHMDVSPDAAFTAGLLHDIGKLVMVMLKADQVPLLGGEMGYVAPGVHVIEQQHLGYSHGEVGAALLMRWNLPELLVDAVRRHHEAPVSEGAALEDLIRVADYYAWHRLTESPATLGVNPPDSILARRGLNHGQVLNLLEELPAQVDVAGALLAD